MKLIAEKAFTWPFFGGKPLHPGDEFEADEAHVTALIGGKLARASEKTEKRKYQRRDLVAENNEIK